MQARIKAICWGCGGGCKSAGSAPAPAVAPSLLRGGLTGARMLLCCCSVYLLGLIVAECNQGGLIAICVFGYLLACRRVYGVG